MGSRQGQGPIEALSRLAFTPPSAPTGLTALAPPDRLIAPARLRALLQSARLYPLVQGQHFSLTKDSMCFVVNRRTTYQDHEVILKRVFLFSADDTLVFHARIRNRRSETILFLPSSLGISVGKRRFQQSLAEMPEPVPACGETLLKFAVSGGINGVPEGLSPKNEFQLVFDRIGPVVGKRCR